MIVLVGRYPDISKPRYQGRGSKDKIRQRVLLQLAFKQQQQLVAVAGAQHLAHRLAKRRCHASKDSRIATTSYFYVSSCFFFSPVYLLICCEIGILARITGELRPFLQLPTRATWLRSDSCWIVVLMSTCKVALVMERMLLWPLQARCMLVARIATKRLCKSCWMPVPT